MTTTLENVSFSFPLQLIKQVEEAGEFHVVGYAATTDFDMQGDIITEEALQNASLDLLKNSTVLLNHDLAHPIGRVTKCEFDKHGLLIDALISSTEPSIIQKIKEGVLNKFSIRGQVLERDKKYMPEYDRVVNVIRKIALVEVSLVSVPANPEAKAIGWYLSKALEETAKAEGGSPMSEEQPTVEEISPQADPAKGKEEPPKPDPEKAPAPAAEVPAAPAQDPTQSPAEIQKDLLGKLEPMFVKKDDLQKMIAEEVQKQLEASLKAVPTVRKGLITQDSEVDDVKKKIESLPPEKKLRAALALQQA